MKNITQLSIIAFSLFTILSTGCKPSDKSDAKHAEEKVIYVCPMDCESGKTYDKPGNCPVCEMSLETNV